MKRVGFICGPKVYRFRGYYFEVNSYCGPWPLNKDGIPRARAPGLKFWRMWEKFDRLSDKQKEKYRAGGIGGCVPVFHSNK